jgi:hypothetical protein
MKQEVFSRRKEFRIKMGESSYEFEKQMPERSMVRMILLSAVRAIIIDAFEGITAVRADNTFSSFLCHQRERS